MDLPSLDLSDEKLEIAVMKVLDGFVIGMQQAMNLKQFFSAEMQEGLKGGLSLSSLQMEDTHVHSLLDGSEAGKFMALDLGGTNFRVLLIELKEGLIIKTIVEHYTISEGARHGNGAHLFDYLADCVKDFLCKNSATLGACPEIPLGFTFSFPIKQLELNKGLLLSWTKSFNCSGVVGKDVVELLSASLDRKGCENVKVLSILNDCTGILIKGSLEDKNTCIGFGLGTGANATYLERTFFTSETVIDTEFGALGDKSISIDFIKTSIDQDVDLMSLLPGTFSYEKMFSGKYLGSLLQNILRTLYKRGCFLNEIESDLERVGVLTTSDISLVMNDVVTIQSTQTEILLKRLCREDGISLRKDDILIVQEVCRILSERCALLAAIPLSVCLERVGRGASETSTIAASGSLLKYHPTIKSSIEKYIQRTTTNQSAVHMLITEDGSGIGAALLAAIASR